MSENTPNPEGGDVPLVRKWRDEIDVDPGSDYESGVMETLLRCANELASSSAPYGWLDKDDNFLTNAKRERMIEAGQRDGASIGEVTFGKIARAHDIPLYQQGHEAGRSCGVGDDGSLMTAYLAGRFDRRKDQPRDAEQRDDGTVAKLDLSNLPTEWPWDEGSPCLDPRPIGMVYPELPTPRAFGYLDKSGVEWAAYDTGQVEDYGRRAFADGANTVLRSINPDAVEVEKAWNDVLSVGTGYMLDGQRIDPSRVTRALSESGGGGVLAAEVVDVGCASEVAAHVRWHTNWRDLPVGTKLYTAPAQAPGSEGLKALVAEWKVRPGVTDAYKICADELEAVIAAAGGGGQ